MAKKKLHEKLYTEQILGGAKVVRLAQSCVCKTTFGDSSAAGNACEATSIYVEFGFGIGSRSSRRLQWARHAHNKCIASGAQKHALFVCGDVANISAHARPHRESAERNSNCNCCYRDYSAQPREGNNNYNTSMQQQAQHFNATAITTTACPRSKKQLSILQLLRIPVLFVLIT